MPHNECRSSVCDYNVCYKYKSVHVWKPKNCSHKLGLLRFIRCNKNYKNNPLTNLPHQHPHSHTEQSDGGLVLSSLPLGWACCSLCSKEQGSLKQHEWNVTRTGASSFCGVCVCACVYKCMCVCVCVCACLHARVWEERASRRCFPICFTSERFDFLNPIPVISFIAPLHKGEERPPLAATSLKDISILCQPRYMGGPLAGDTHAH